MGMPHFRKHELPAPTLAHAETKRILARPERTPRCCVAAVHIRLYRECWADPAIRRLVPLDFKQQVKDELSEPNAEFRGSDHAEDRPSQAQRVASRVLCHRPHRRRDRGRLSSDLCCGGTTAAAPVKRRQVHDRPSDSRACSGSPLARPHHRDGCGPVGRPGGHRRHGRRVVTACVAGPRFALLGRRDARSSGSRSAPTSSTAAGPSPPRSCTSLRRGTASAEPARFSRRELRSAIGAGNGSP
jgi:hypothetical protein